MTLAHRILIGSEQDVFSILKKSTTRAGNRTNLMKGYSFRLDELDALEAQLYRLWFAYRDDYRFKFSEIDPVFMRTDFIRYVHAQLQRHVREGKTALYSKVYENEESLQELVDEFGILKASFASTYAFPNGSVFKLELIPDANET